MSGECGVSRARTKPLSQRSPITTGAAGIAVLLSAVLVAANVHHLPGMGKTYTAHFTEAAGLRPDNEVRVAGVKVGEVSGVALESDHAVVSFRVQHVWIGDNSTAAIKIKTLLGQKYLALEPKGSRELSTSEPIPVQRTMSPYDVIEAFSDLSNTVSEIDTRQLAQSFYGISQTFANTSADVRGALSGLSALSQTISQRDMQLKELLKNTSAVSETIADRNAEFEKLLADANPLLAELRKRRDSINSLLTGIQELSAQLSGLVDDNARQLGPTLAQLDRVTKMLQRNQDNLSNSIRLFAYFGRMASNASGNGRWFDGYICGVLPPSIGPVNGRGCTP